MLRINTKTTTSRELMTDKAKKAKIRTSLKVRGVKVRKSHNYMQQSLTTAYHKFQNSLNTS